MEIREFPGVASFLAVAAQLLDIRNTDGNWVFLAQFPAIFGRFSV